MSSTYSKDDIGVNNTIEMSILMSQMDSDRNNHIIKKNLNLNSSPTKNPKLKSELK